MEDHCNVRQQGRGSYQFRFSHFLYEFVVEIISIYDIKCPPKNGWDQFSMTRAHKSDKGAGCGLAALF